MHSKKTLDFSLAIISKNSKFSNYEAFSKYHQDFDFQKEPCS